MTIKKKKFVYIIIGQTGEYSDNQNWSVIAYFDENKAKEHVLKAQQRANEIHVESEKSENKWKHIRENKNEFDPFMNMDYTGTTYYYDTVEIVK